MVKTILLKCDEKFFYMLKEDKQRREKNVQCNLTWEEYIKILFKQNKELKGGKNGN